MTRTGLLLAMLIAALAGTTARAGSVTDTFDVTLTIEPGCIVSADNDLNFGTASFLDTSLVAQVDIVIKCTSGTTGTVALDNGLGSGATPAARAMSAGTDVINYALFTNVNHTTLWGDGLNGSVTVSHAGSGANTTLTVYGMTSVSATAPAAGTYSDTITVTVAY